MTKLYILLSGGTALLLHIVLGWEFAVVGAIIAGVLFKDRPVIAGILTLTLCWGGLVVYNFSVATAETIRMVRIMSLFVGDLPPIATVGITVGIAFVLGAAGGWLGSVISKKESN